MIQKIDIYILMVLLFTSCNSNNMEKQPVARVYDTYLFSDEIESFIPKSASSDDSILMAESYTRNWITQHLLLHNAENNLSDAQKSSIQKQVNDYRMSLLIHLYKQELINKHFTPEVTEQQIEAYYKSNKDNFLLATPVIKGAIVIIPKETGEKTLKLFRELLQSNKEADKTKLEELSMSSAKKFDNFNNNWIEVKYILNLIPGDVRELENAVSYKKFIEKADDESYYFLRIDEIKQEQTIAPLEYVREEILLILENQNKINTEYELEEEINQEARRKNNVTIY